MAEDKQSQFVDFAGGPVLQYTVPGIPLAASEIDDKLAEAKKNPKPTSAQVKELLVAVGFNDYSVRQLMEVDPRIALMAAEAKVKFEADPQNWIRNGKGEKIGTKTFEVQARGGYRTVDEQKAAESAGNSNANGDKYESRHQWGGGVDFWIYDKTVDKTGKVTQKALPDLAKYLPIYERVADSFAATDTAKTLGISRPEMRTKVNGHTDWGHIQLPKRYREQWYRDPKTGVVYIDGQKQPGTGIDPKLHPNAGPTYVKQGQSKFANSGGAGKKKDPRSEKKKSPKVAQKTP
jgi:hypothetical protein